MTITNWNFSRILTWAQSDVIIKKRGSVHTCTAADDYELLAAFLSEVCFAIKCHLVEWRMMHSLGKASVQGSMFLERLEETLYVPFQ